MRLFTNVPTTMRLRLKHCVVGHCGIEWPLSGDPILSDKDAIAPALADLDSPFVYGENS